MRLSFQTAKAGVAALALGAVALAASMPFSGDGESETGNVEACSEATKLANLLGLKSSGGCNCSNGIYGWTCFVEADG
ncbi:hypothetical protein ACSFA3_15630 [Variovorax sp. RHLX14]|uniref:hypothetical protein n=1 Tax=Variovorax sp. RHLX14 TaxID=1259731 RepID=UPI003F4569E2